MRILSIKQPWASLIVHGFKDIENRSWRTHYRGPLIIHASQSHDRDSLARNLSVEYLSITPENLYRGQIIGMVELFDCVETSPSVWFEGPWGWRMRNARIVDPIPFTGALGLITPSRAILNKLGLAS